MALRNAKPFNIKRFKGLNSYAKREDVSAEWWTAAMNVVPSAKGSAEVLRSPRPINVSVGSGNAVLSMADYFSTQTHKLFFDIVVKESQTPSIKLTSTSTLKLLTTSRLTLRSSAPALKMLSTSTLKLKGTSNLKLHTNTNDGLMSTYTINDDLTNNAVRTDQAAYAFVSTIVNGKLYRVNQYEFIQFIEDASTHYRVGIDPPAAAPTISYSGGAADSDSDDILSGIQFSYAYYNSTTQDCSRPSPISNRLDAGGEAILVPVVASTETGVDKVVFFATLDGGDIPYLLIDTNGDPVTETNASATYTFNVVDLEYDTLTPEPAYNYPPPIGAQFMFSWKDRLFLCDFVPGSDVDKSETAYSGFESVYIGQPGSSWPVLNRIGIPNKNETLQGGIGTQLGALFLSDTDAYLLSGYPTDKTQGPEATTTVTEHMEPLHWNIGTRSARTLKATPFGHIWLDHAKRLRKWNGESFPVEIAIPLRKELDKLDSAELDSVEGAWYQMGKNGGYYALTGTLKNGSQQLYLVVIYEDPETGEKTVGYGISDIQAYTLQPVRIFDDIRLVYGGIDRTFEILNPEWAGAGWPDQTQIFFEHTLGNDGNFSYWHSLRFDAGGSIDGLTISIRDFGEDITAARTVEVEAEDDTGGAYFGLIDEEGRRKILRFSYDTTDDESDTFESGVSSETETDPREIKNLQIVYNNKKRVI